MRLLTHHPQDEAWEFDPTRVYPDLGPSMKPNGLWLSVDDDWNRWCTENGMTWCTDAHEFRIVKPEAVLHLDTPDSLVTFTREWVDRNCDTFLGRPDRYRIDWGALRDEWAGIVIAPYHWEHRLSSEVSWYYPWDCASACIWDLSAVEAV